MENNNISADSVFIKQSEIKPKPTKLHINEILKTIPENSFHTPQADMKKTKIEHRWRILQINNKKYVEISFLSSDNKRTFINKYGEFIQSNVDEKYNDYVVDIYYYYSDT